MDRRKLIKKLIIYALVLVLLVIGVFFSYIRYGGYWLTDKETRSEIISEIKAAPQLPDNFMKVYNDLYLEVMEKSGWQYVFNRLPFGQRHEYSSSMAIAYECGASRLHGAFFYIEQFNFVLEDSLTPQECLNKYLQMVDFGRAIGVEDAAQVYFNKSLNQLNEDQVLEILVRLKNPSLYNKERKNRQKFFMNRFYTLKGKLEQNRGAK